MCSLFSQDIKTGFFGGGGALLPDGLVRLRAVVLANEMRGRKEGLCSREGGGHSRNREDRLLTPLLSGGEPVKSCVSMAGVLPPCRVPVRRPTTKPKRRPTLVAGLPIRKYLTQMKRPHLKYANAPRQARRKRGRREGGKGGRVDDDTCTRVARNCTFARPPPPMREGARG